MPYKKAPKDHTEFGGGDGLIDPVRRADRVIGQNAGPLVQGPNEELMEIYFSDPSRADENLAETELGRQRLA